MIQKLVIMSYYIWGTMYESGYGIDFVTHGLLSNGGNQWSPRVYLIEIRILFHIYVQWIQIARSGEFF